MTALDDRHWLRDGGVRYASAVVTPRIRTNSSGWIIRSSLSVALILGAVWFFLPLAILLALHLPPYAFGHEPIGVRFFQAWVPIRDHGNYPFVMVGHLLDLFHRGMLSFLIWSGYLPEKDLIRTMTLFSNVSLSVHAGVMAIISAIVMCKRALPPAFRILLLITGMSLGYVFYWSPLHLFTPDYPLTSIVIAYIFVSFALIRVTSEYGQDDVVPSIPSAIWHRGIPTAVLTAATLFLKLSLIPYAMLIFLLGTLGIPRRQSWWVTGVAAATMSSILALLWFLLQGFNAYNALYSARELALELARVKPVEPFFHVKDFATPGTIYFIPFLGFMIWLAISLSACLFPEDRRLRLIPVAVLLGGIFYLYVLVKRPGNASVSEILVYWSATGTLCVILQQRSVRLGILLGWCIILSAQTVYVARSAYPGFVSSARYTAEIAQDVDKYARSFALPILYVYPDHGIALNDVFQSAESAVFKGTLYCTFVQLHCGQEARKRLFSIVLKPYQMVGASEKLPTYDKFVLMFADVPEAPSIIQQNSMAREAFFRASVCQQWKQWRHTVHVCVIPTR